MTKAVNERQLLSAVERVVDLVNDGAAPTDAVIKVASTSQLRPGEVRLVAQAYNTGRTRQQQTHGGDPFEKSAEFPLADAAAALEALYPTTIKTAAEVERENVVSFDYSVSPHGLLERQKKAASQRVSLVDAWKPTSPEPYPSEQREKTIKRAGQEKRAERFVEESRRLANIAMDKSASSFYALLDYFKQPSHASYHSVKAAAATVYGEAGERVMARVCGCQPYLVKDAQAKFDYTADTQPLPLIGDLITAIRYQHVRTEIHQKLAAAYAYATSKPAPATAGDSLLDGLQKTAVDMSTVVMGNFAKDTLSSAAKRMAPPDQGAAVAQMTQSLTDPEHESQLRNIRMQSLLQDLITEDDVIRAHPPEDVLQAFNEIGELSPRSVDQHLLTQAMLRKRLEQGVMDPFEADQILAIDRKLQQRNEPSRTSSSSIL